MTLAAAGFSFGGMIAPPLVAVVLSYPFWPGSPEGGDPFPHLTLHQQDTARRPRRPCDR